MKIITKDYNNNFYCYIQVRDLAYLVEQKRLTIFKLLYEKLLNAGMIYTDFIRIKDPSMIEVILHIDEIIDFNDYQKLDALSLSRILVNSAYSSTKQTEHKCESIRDIIAFNKGELEYKIPVLPTNKFACLSTEKNISFQTSSVPNFYILRSEDDIPITEKDYQAFLEQQIQDVIRMEHLKEYETNITPMGPYIIIRIERKKPVKESIFKRIFKKQSNN